MALRMGVQLGVFTQVSEKPEQGVTSTKISEDTGASFILVGKNHLSIGRYYHG